MTNVANVVIDSGEVTADLTDFVLLVDLSDMPTGFWSSVVDGGGDIRVFKSDGTTELAREIVSCDTGTDTGEIWIKFSGVLSSSSDTTIQIHTDGTSSEPGTTDTYGRNNVWSDYVAVLHLEDSNYTDSTGNGNSGTGTSVTQVTGQVGGGASLPGSNNNKVEISDDASLDFAGDFHLSAWLKANSPTSDSRSQRYGPSQGWLFPWIDDSPNKYRMVVWGGSTAADVTGTSTPTTNWTHLHGIKNASSVAIAVNGTVEATKTVTLGSVSSNAAYRIGVNAFGDQETDGIFDEVRIAGFAASSSWISTEYNNQSSPSTFYTASAPAGGGTAITANNGSVLATGQQASLAQPIELQATPGSVLATGQQASLVQPIELQATPGSVLATGQQGTLTLGNAVTIVATPGQVAANSQQGNFATALFLVANNGHLVAESQQGAVGIGTGPAPKDRTFIVEADARLFVVEADARLFVVN